jgi:hypothetical protein
MRASLFARATPATLRCVRDVSWAKPPAQTGRLLGTLLHDRTCSLHE